MKGASRALFDSTIPLALTLCRQGSAGSECNLEAP